MILVLSLAEEVYLSPDKGWAFHVHGSTLGENNHLSKKHYGVQAKNADIFGLN